MCSNLKIEDTLCRVKEELNREKIKLWLEPYYDDKNGVGSDEEQALQLLCQKIAEKLNIDQEQCLSTLRDLQNHSLDRLKSNQVFKETGVACLKVKVSGEAPRHLTVNITLTATVTSLIEEVAREIDLPCSRIKMISMGKVLKPCETLSAQGIKNGMQLMAVILAADNDKMEEAEKRFKTLESTKKDVQLLAGRSNANNEYYLQVENQAGEAMNLPYYERKALVTAMTLHEKGRVALKKEDYSLALVLFLEADKEYSECTSELLKSVDNYALLHLDIAWCYLCLRNPAQIPDADRRLSLCEKNFHCTYGPNLERLMAIKGATGSEAALFMRLHLLQGVVLFHQNKRVEAKALFERAQQELNGLKIDGNSLCILLELGYKSSEACLALRSTQGNVELAEEFINRRHREKELSREKNRSKYQIERKQYCEPDFVKRLVSMGFDREQSISALKMANNVMSEAITILQDQPHLLPSTSRNINEEVVAQVTSMGVSAEIAREALEKNPHLEDAVKALNDLSKTAGAVDALAAASDSVSKMLEEFSKKRKKKVEEEMKAFQRVSEDLIGSDLTDDHLDMNLVQEEQFLVEYLSLLN